MAQLAPRVESFRFQPISAKGWFNKTSKLVAEFPDGAGTREDELWSMQYSYDEASNTGSVTSTKTSWISVENATHAYLQLDIDPDSKGFVKGNDIETLRTDKQKHIDRIAYDDKPLTEPINMISFSDCDVVRTYGWEDGGDNDYRDFIFEIETKCSATPEAVEYVRLVE